MSSVYMKKIILGVGPESEGRGPDGLFGV